MPVRQTVLFGLAALLTIALFAQDVVTQEQSPAADQRGHGAIAGNYIVMFEPGTPAASRASSALIAGAIVRFNYTGVSATAVTVPNANALAALENWPNVTRVVPDYIQEAAVKGGNGGGGKPGGGGGDPPPPEPLNLDTGQQVSYAVQRVGMPVMGSDGVGVGVAVLDSGIDYNHPDLAPSNHSFNAFQQGGSCQDDGGHGTHVAGLIAALNNDIAILGVAPAATLYCVKVLDSDLMGSDSLLMAGLDWVLQNHASFTPPIRVVNLSIGRPLNVGETVFNTVLRAQIQQLRDAGIVVVAAAGNDPNLEISQVVPAGIPEVFAVASSIATSGIRTCLLFNDPSLGYVPVDTASGFTTDGPAVVTSAPGEERTDIVFLGSSGCVGLQYGILSTTLGTDGATRKLFPSLQEARGTSFSAPLVSGIVARVIQKQLVPATGDAAEVEGIRTWIEQNADRPGQAPLDHPWAGSIYVYSFDGTREGIAQAPK